jgi:hypothetical protein
MVWHRLTAHTIDKTLLPGGGFASFHHQEAETTKAVHTPPGTALVSGSVETKLLLGFLRFNLDNFDALV